MIYKYIISFLVALTISVISIYIYRMIAKKVGLVDKPNARKVHTDLIPLVGGIGVFTAVLISLVMT